MADSLVTLEELAERIGIEGDPAEYVRARGHEIVIDWQGAAAVTSDTASLLVAAGRLQWDTSTWPMPDPDPPERNPTANA